MSKLQMFLLRMGFAAERKRVYQILGRAAKDGRPLLDVMQNIMKFQKSGSPVNKVFRLVLSRIRSGGGVGGKGVATVGSEFVGIIPEDERILITAGEASSKMYEGYMGAYSVVEWRENMAKEFRSALATPALLVVAVFGLLFVISTQVIPEFSKMFKILPPDLQLLDTISKNFFLIFGIFFGGIIATIVFYKYLFNTLTGEIRASFDATIFNFSTQLACAFFMQNMSNFIASGMSITDAVQKLSETNNRYLRYQFNLILHQIRKGIPFDQTLLNISLVPKKYHWVLAAYGMMSEKDKMYASIATEVKENVSAAMKKIAIALNLVSLLLFAAVLGFTYYTLMNSAMSLSRM